MDCFTIGVRIYGGLGNQLFQIGNALAISEKTGRKLIIEQPETLEGWRQKVYWNKFIHGITLGKNPNFFLIYKEPDHLYRPIPIPESSLVIDGYFQSEKYFKDFRNIILSHFHLLPSDENYLLSKYQDIKERNCLHVRLGDILNIQHMFPVPPKKYFEWCINQLSENKYAIFTDSPEVLSNYLPDLRNLDVIYPLEEDYLELGLMSMCKNFICSNSTFSWWASWLSENRKKKVFFPYPWIGPGITNLDISDLFYNGCTLVDYSSL